MASAGATESIQRMDFPVEIAALEEALVSARKYTMAIYCGLPDSYWVPATFPYLQIVNPPLWELAHIAWFAEYFCLRWRNEAGEECPPCLLERGDELFDSARVAHPSRWTNDYPTRERILWYLDESLHSVQQALRTSGPSQRYFFRLALAHEIMHGEALVMTLVTLDQPVPECVASRQALSGTRRLLAHEGGRIVLGQSGRTFQFDNEQPATDVQVMPFKIDSRVISESEFCEFAGSRAYRDDRLWSRLGSEWRHTAGDRNRQSRGDFAAMHVSYFEAEAWCRWAGRRLPTEAEWEFAAAHPQGISGTVGHVWEWTSTAFTGYPGFAPGPYREYSAPWFGNHTVLRGGSFVTNPLLRYAQYRNFYQPHRRDMFCGFRSCAVT